MNRKIFLSYTLSVSTPMYGENEAPSIVQRSSILQGKSSNSFKISFHNHSGTHVDAPAHFIQGGKRIDEYEANELLFSRVFVFTIPKNPGEWIEEKDLKDKVRSIPTKIDSIIFCTGFHARRTEGVYLSNNPGISPEAIAWLRIRFPKLRCIGIDSLSISSFSDRPRGRKAHIEAFMEKQAGSVPLLLIEDMDLSGLGNNKIKNLFLFPLRVYGVDSAPCTIIAEVEDD